MSVVECQQLSSGLRSVAIHRHQDETSNKNDALFNNHISLFIHLFVSKIKHEK